MKSELIHLPILDYYSIVNFFSGQSVYDDVPIERLLGQALANFSKRVSLEEAPKAHHGLFGKKGLVDIVIDSSYVSEIARNSKIENGKEANAIERYASYFAALPDYRKREFMDDENHSKEMVSAK